MRFAPLHGRRRTHFNALSLSLFTPQSSDDDDDDDDDDVSFFLFRFVVKKLVFSGLFSVFFNFFFSLFLFSKTLSAAWGARFLLPFFFFFFFFLFFGFSLFWFFFCIVFSFHHKREEKIESHLFRASEVRTIVCEYTHTRTHKYTRDQIWRCSFVSKKREDFLCARERFSSLLCCVLFFFFFFLFFIS